VRARDHRPSRIEARLADRRVVRMRIHGGAQSTQQSPTVKLYFAERFRGASEVADGICPRARANAL
jgi:hypothetical protein